QRQASCLNAVAHRGLQMPEAFLYQHRAEARHQRGATWQFALHHLERDFVGAGHTYPNLISRIGDGLACALGKLAVLQPPNQCVRVEEQVHGTSSSAKPISSGLSGSKKVSS